MSGRGSLVRREGIWHISYYVNGVRYRQSANTKVKGKAIALLNQKLKEAEELYPVKHTAQSATVSTLLDMVLEYYGRKGKDRYIEGLRINKRLKPALGRIKVDRFESRHITEYVALRRRQGASNSTINRELALLRRGFVLGERNEPRLIYKRPHIEKLDEGDNVRKGFLRRDDYKRLLDAMHQDVKLLLIIGYHTGMRRTALLDLKWEQVDLQAGVIRVQPVASRNRKPVATLLPIYGDMGPFLSAAAIRSEYVFTWSNGRRIKDFRRQWAKATEEAGLPNLLFHDLRRSAARNLRRAGVPESVCMRITGHKTRSMFDRYNITDEEDVKDAGDSLENLWKKEDKEN